MPQKSVRFSFDQDVIFTFSQTEQTNHLLLSPIVKKLGSFLLFPPASVPPPK